MFLAVDIGNSATKIGLFDGNLWQTVRIDATSELFDNEFLKAIEHIEAHGAGIASVVPQRTDHVAGLIRLRTDPDPVIVSASMDLPFEMAYETPGTLGADRIAAAAAAWLTYGKQGERGVIALDAGTAVTLEIVNAEGTYLGGAIAPGPLLLRQSLAGGTAQLPDVDWPETILPVGTSTKKSIETGVSVMFLDGVLGLLDRTISTFQTPPIVVATGGWAPWLARHTSTIDELDPNLVLKGIRLLSDR